MAQPADERVVLSTFRDKVSCKDKVETGKQGQVGGWRGGHTTEMGWTGWKGAQQKWVGGVGGEHDRN